MALLFSPLTIRGIELKNRIVMSPMCQYSSANGLPTDWHFVHYVSRAAGGAALILSEATAVSPEGRITPDDAGIWNEDQAAALKRINDSISAHHAVPGVQLAHAGRKASTYAPGKGEGALPITDGGWQTFAPSAVKFAERYTLPKAMTKDDIRSVVVQFAQAAARSVLAGYRVIELHMAHGYLVHQFLSPFSNKRTDEYGGCFENRTRLALEILDAVRRSVPDSMPVFIRISATDWTEGGWDIEQTTELARTFKNAGADLIDTSSGGNIPHAVIPAGPGYQVPLAGQIRHGSGIMTGAVGLITSPHQAEEILASGDADLIILARELLRHPYWPLDAAQQLQAEIEWPRQYLRAKR